MWPSASTLGHIRLPEIRRSRRTCLTIFKKVWRGAPEHHLNRKIMRSMWLMINRLGLYLMQSVIVIVLYYIFWMWRYQLCFRQKSFEWDLWDFEGRWLSYLCVVHCGSPWIHIIYVLINRPCQMCSPSPSVWTALHWKKKSFGSSFSIYLVLFKGRWTYGPALFLSIDHKSTLVVLGKCTLRPWP